MNMAIIFSFTALRLSLLWPAQANGTKIYSIILLYERVRTLVCRFPASSLEQNFGKRLKLPAVASQNM